MHFRLGNKQTLKVIEDLGLLSDEPIAKGGSPLDTVRKINMNKFKERKKKLFSALETSYKEEGHFPKKNIFI